MNCAFSLIWINLAFQNSCTVFLWKVWNSFLFLSRWFSCILCFRRSWWGDGHDRTDRFTQHGRTKPQQPREWWGGHGCNHESTGSRCWAWWSCWLHWSAVATSLAGQTDSDVQVSTTTGMMMQPLLSSDSLKEDEGLRWSCWLLWSTVATSLAGQTNVTPMQMCKPQRPWKWWSSQGFHHSLLKEDAGLGVPVHLISLLWPLPCWADRYFSPCICASLNSHGNCEAFTAFMRFFWKKAQI